jgi:hypothetical protein
MSKLLKLLKRFELLKCQNIKMSKHYSNYNWKNNMSENGEIAREKKLCDNFRLDTLISEEKIHVCIKQPDLKL